MISIISRKMYKREFVYSKFFYFLYFKGTGQLEIFKKSSFVFLNGSLKS